MALLRIYDQIVGQLAGVLVTTTSKGNLKQDGTEAFAQAVTLVDTGGTPTNFATETTQLLVKSDLDTLVALGQSAAPVNVVGNTASGSALSDAPVYQGGRAMVSIPTAVTNGQAVGEALDKLGRPVVYPVQVRELRTSATVTITSSTAFADLLAAGGAGIYQDLLSVTLVNTSATGTVVQLADADDTTIIWTGYAPPTDMRGIVFAVPLKAVNANAKWRVKTVASVASVTITAQFAQDK